MRPWAAVNGPAAATVATAARLGWNFINGHSVTTDDGKTLNFELDPPTVIKKEVDAAVRRWRWARVVGKNLALAGGAADGEQVLGPIRRLLSPAARNAQWVLVYQAALRSAVTNGQWPQARLAAAGLVDADGCE